MNFYSYDSITNAFVGVGVADPNPLVPGEFLIPAFATTVAPPPLESDHVAVWSSGVWTMVPNAFVAPGEEPLTLDQAKAKKREFIKAEAVTDITSGFAFIGKLIDSDPQSQSNILVAAQLSQLPGAPATVEWRARDNTFITLTAADVLAMANALGNHIKASYARKWQREALIATATTIDELAAI